MLPNSTLVISGCQISFQSRYPWDFGDNQLWRCTQAGSECHCYSQGEFHHICYTLLYHSSADNWIICTYIEEDATEIGQNVSFGCFRHDNVINWKLWLPMWWCCIKCFIFLQRWCLLPVGLNSMNEFILYILRAHLLWLIFEDRNIWFPKYTIECLNLYHNTCVIFVFSFFMHVVLFFYYYYCYICCCTLFSDLKSRFRPADSKYVSSSYLIKN